MKKTSLLLLIIFTSLLLINCKNEEKGKKIEDGILVNSCECIKLIPLDQNNSKIIENTRKCISDSYEKYPKELGSLVDKYLKSNPGSKVKDAQYKIREVVAKNLIKYCPRYKQIAISFAKNK